MIPFKFNGCIQETQQLKSQLATSSNDFNSLLSIAAKNSINPISNSSVDLRPYCSPVENQYSLGSCVGNSICNAFELLNIVQGNSHTDLSRLFVYFNSRNEHNSVDKDDGTYVGLAMQTASKQGLCAESLWAYDVSKVFLRPDWNAYREGRRHRFSSYHHLDVSDEQDLINSIKECLKLKHPVVFGVKVFEDINFCKGVVKMPSGKLLGNHAMCIVGFDDGFQHFIVKNSWGNAWGDKGYGYFPYSYLMAAEAKDFWCPTLWV